MVTPPPSPANQTAAMPMFYKAPRPLDRAKDANKRVLPPTDFSFAAKTNAIPLLADELPMAAAHYPIVFSDGPTPVPAAIVGLQNDQNLFVNDAGQWQVGSYLPAYVRRYPFILMDDPTTKQFILCLDEASGRLSETEGQPLFNGEQPSDFTKSAMEFCAMLRQQGEATDEFMRALKEHNLLVSNESQIEAINGVRIQLGGFLVIDAKKFDQLPDNIYLQWRKKGWLGLIFAQLLSTHRWQNLATMLPQTQNQVA